jgi:hypothetical protein
VVALLFPSFTFRSSGFRGSSGFDGGMFRSGADPVNQTSGSTFRPGLTVARLLEGLFARYMGADARRQLTTGEFLGTLREAERKRQGIDISLNA